MKAYIINLKNSIGRRDSMCQEIHALRANPLYETLGLEFEFFNAIEPRNADFENLKNTFFAPKRCFMLHGRILSDNEIACYASNYMLWQRCVERNEPIMVFEDDIAFEPHFLSAVDTIVRGGHNLSTKRGDLALVRFRSSDRKRDKYIKPIKPPFYYSLRNTNGLQGYYLTPKAARAFLSQKYWDCPVDVQVEFVSRTHIHNIIYKPFPIREVPALAQESTIQKGHINKVEIPLIYRLLRPFYRNGIYLKRAIFKMFYKPPKID